MRFLVVPTLVLLSASLLVTATPIAPGDPRILIDTGGDSLPISTNIDTVQPSTNCPTVEGILTCTFDFFNDTGRFLTSFQFETIVNTGLSAQAVGAFTCADPFGFFEDCSVHYTSDTGDLKYLFFGVVSPSNGIDPPGPHGIPPDGHFIIVLEGWSPGATSGGEQLYPDLPHLDDTFTTSPEPSAWVTLGTGLTLLAAMAYRRRRAQS
jgi:hypothetical protein